MAKKRLCQDDEIHPTRYPLAPASALHGLILTEGRASMGRFERDEPCASQTHFPSSLSFPLFTSTQPTHDATPPFFVLFTWPFSIPAHYLPLFILGTNAP